MKNAPMNSNSYCTIPAIITKFLFDGIASLAGQITLTLDTPVLQILGRQREEGWQLRYLRNIATVIGIISFSVQEGNI
jgi:hypothetical protein